MLLDQARHQARLLSFGDEIAKEGRARGIAFRRADRLLNGGVIVGKNLAPRHLFYVLQQSLPQTGERIELIADELVERSVGGIGAKQRRVFEVARQPQIVSGAAADRDA